VTRIEARLRSEVPSVDVDVYARYDSDPELDEEGTVVAGWGARGPTGNENLIIAAEPGTTLAEGTYYFALVLFSRRSPAAGSLSVTLSRVNALSETFELRLEKDADRDSSVDVPSKGQN
jgi:hypothetical protein